MPVARWRLNAAGVNTHHWASDAKTSRLPHRWWPHRHADAAGKSSRFEQDCRGDHHYVSVDGLIGFHDAGKSSLEAVNVVDDTFPAADGPR